MTSNRGFRFHMRCVEIVCFGSPIDRLLQFPPKVSLFTNFLRFFNLPETTFSVAGSWSRDSRILRQFGPHPLFQRTDCSHSEPFHVPTSPKWIEQKNPKSEDYKLELGTISTKVSAAQSNNLRVLKYDLEPDNEVMGFGLFMAELARAPYLKQLTYGAIASGMCKEVRFKKTSQLSGSKRILQRFDLNDQVGIYLPCYDIFRNWFEEFAAENAPSMAPYAPLPDEDVILDTSF
ncbi:hypothetical protein L2E82_30266 [Cichorium intybus]|uniref:Uncharacterized protein n=1 Tax=Cichorium intybus TaxID=13427 RepID=A0ACB9CZU7_CICIN|nr:hypothetical protein L2E82_30266 [Cichorium intybus]